MSAEASGGLTPHPDSAPGSPHSHAGLNSDAGAATHTGAQAVVADAAARTGTHAVIAASVDPARRPDVLFRVRGGDDHQLNPWWLVGAFVFVSGAAIVLLSFVPGGS